MTGWVLLGVDRQEVPVKVYPDQDLVEADLSDVPDVYQEMHWHAPHTYLGDKVGVGTLWEGGGDRQGGQGSLQREVRAGRGL